MMSGGFSDHDSVFFGGIRVWMNLLRRPGDLSVLVTVFLRGWHTGARGKFRVGELVPVFQVRFPS